MRSAPLILLLAGLGACADPPAGDAGATPDAGPADRAPGLERLLLVDVPVPERDAGPGCDELGAGGRCEDGGLLRWCQQGEPRSADCAALGLGCGAQPALGGLWCLAGAGQSCARWPCLPSLRCDEARVCRGEDAGGEDREP